MIQKAIITAAGRGTRFLPTVKYYPKELIAIMDKPNIQILVEEIIAAGIKEICIVHRPGDVAIKGYFTPDLELEKYLKANNKYEFLSSLQYIWDNAKLEFVAQGDDLPYGNASPALAAKEFIGQDDFAYVLGDDLIIEDKIGTYLGKMIENFEKYNCDAVISTQEMPPVEMKRYGAVKPVEKSTIPDLPAGRQVSELVEKVENPPSNFAVVGRYIVKNKIMDVIANQGISRGELWFADALNTLAKTGLAIHEPITNGIWMTTGDPIRWLKANIVYALKQPQFHDELTEFLKNPTK